MQSQTAEGWANGVIAEAGNRPNIVVYAAAALSRLRITFQVTTTSAITL